MTLLGWVVLALISSVQANDQDNGILSAHVDVGTGSYYFTTESKPPPRGKLPQGKALVVNIMKAPWWSFTFNAFCDMVVVRCLFALLGDVPGLAHTLELLVRRFLPAGVLQPAPMSSPADRRRAPTLVPTAADGAAAGLNQWLLVLSTAGVLPLAATILRRRRYAALSCSSSPSRCSSGAASAGEFLSAADKTAGLVLSQEEGQGYVHNWRDEILKVTRALVDRSLGAKGVRQPPGLAKTRGDEPVREVARKAIPKVSRGRPRGTLVSRRTQEWERKLSNPHLQLPLTSESKDDLHFKRIRTDPLL